MKIINYAKQHVSKRDILEVTKVLKSDFLTQGPISKSFSEKIKSISKAKHCTLFNSATSALHGACAALGLDNKSLLWTSANSFLSSATCGLMCGSKVDFVDIDVNTFNICSNKLETKLKKSKKKPDVLVVVHFAGLPCEMKSINYLSKKYNFKIIEDASHAIGSNCMGFPTGSSHFSDITVFSFHPVKIITTGEGGAALTNSSLLSKKLDLISNQGIERNQTLFKNKKMKNCSWYYEMQSLGYNYRMNDIQSALGMSQLNQIKKFIKKREYIFNYYKKNLDTKYLKLQHISSNVRSSYHLAVATCKNKISKKSIFKKFLHNGIRLQTHYIPIHLHPYFKRLGFKKKQFPICENYYENSFSLPIYYGLNLQDLKKVVNVTKDIFY